MITDNLSAKASVVQMKQYVHLLTTANIGLPTDLWVPVTNKVKPMEAWQYSAGMAYNLNNENINILLSRNVRSHPLEFAIQ